MPVPNEGESAKTWQGTEYDTRVAGVILGAGDCRPGPSWGGMRRILGGAPFTMTGEVYRNVDATIEPMPWATC